MGNYDVQYRHISHEISSFLKMSLGSGGGHIVRLWRYRLLSVPMGEHQMVQ